MLSVTLLNIIYFENCITLCIYSCAAEIAKFTGH